MVLSYDNVIAGNTLSNFYTTPLMLLYVSERTLVEANKISDGARNGVNYPSPVIRLVSSYSIIRCIFRAHSAQAVHITELRRPSIAPAWPAGWRALRRPVPP